MPLQIDTDFPGGNIIVDQIEGDRITLRKDLRDTAGDWFYWAFRCHFPAPGTYRFHITNGNVCGPRGPAVSYDDGITWSWLGRESITTDSPLMNEFAYTASRAESVIFCMGMQYQQVHLDRFLEQHKSPYLTCTELTRSNKGRPVERLHIEKADGREKKYIFLSARHHCCEMMADYVLEGILDAALADDETGNLFRDRYIVDAVPFADKDGVVDGDQGKNRIPYDHARDYGKTEHLYPEVAAIERIILQNHPFFVLDIHCPWIRSGCNETIYFPGLPDKTAEENMLKFSEILERLAPPEAPHYKADNILYGTSWNTDANYSAGLSLGKWVCRQEFMLKFGGTLEVAYANAREVTLTPDACRKLGHAIARAILEFDI